MTLRAPKQVAIDRHNYSRLVPVASQIVGILSFYAASFCAVRYFASETDKHRYGGVAIICFAVMLIGFLNTRRIERRRARWHRQMTEALPPEE